MAKTGVIGLGAMGFPVAVNLIEGGHELYVTYHSNKQPALELEKRGARICSSPREVAQNADLIFLVLPDAPEVEETLFSADGVAAGIRPDGTVFDMSTIDLTRSREFAGRLAAVGGRFLDAPISGGPEGAAAATLAIMVGGDENAFKQYLPILQSLGKSVVHCGESGMGLAAKMANNLLAGAQFAAMAEALSIAIKAGMDPEKLYEVLRNATADSRLLNAKFPVYLSGNYEPGFKLSLMCKDLDIITNAAKKLGTPTPVGSMVEQVFRICKEQYGEKDASAVSLFYQQQAGVDFRARR